MRVLHVPYGEELLAATGLSSEELEAEMRFLLAAKLYELGRVSAGQAGKIASMARLRFLDELGRRGFNVINLTVEDLEDELAHDSADVRQ